MVTPSTTPVRSGSKSSPASRIAWMVAASACWVNVSEPAITRSSSHAAGSKSGTGAIQAYLPVSGSAQGAAVTPCSPASSRAKYSPADWPMQEITPIPVIATPRMCCPFRRSLTVVESDVRINQSPAAPG